MNYSTPVYLLTCQQKYIENMNEYEYAYFLAHGVDYRIQHEQSYEAKALADYGYDD